MAISVDSPRESRDLCQNVGYTFTFLSDPNLDAIRRYDLVHAVQGINGHDIPAGGVSSGFIGHGALANAD